jgi:hypothetical protein
LFSPWYGYFGSRAGCFLFDRFPARGMQNRVILNFS